MNTKVLLRIFVFTALYAVLAYILPFQQGTPTVSYLAEAIITGLLYGILLFNVEIRLQTGRVKRILIVALPIFVIQFINPILEGFFFTTRLNSAATLVGGTVIGVLLSVVYAAAASFLFSPKPDSSSLTKSGETADRGGIYFVKVIVASLSWPLVYFIFGGLVGPIVNPYYADPQSPYYLVLPSLEAIVAVQVVRGFLYLASLIPLMRSLRFSPKGWLLVLTGFMYIGGGLAIFVVIETFPAILRLVHGIEIFADSICFSAVVVYLFKRKRVGS